MAIDRFTHDTERYITQKDRVNQVRRRTQTVTWGEAVLEERNQKEESFEVAGRTAITATQRTHGGCEERDLTNDAGLLWPGNS